MPTYTAPCCGYVSQIDFFYENPGGSTKAEVWTPTYVPSYQLIGEVDISGTGSKLYTVPSANRIRDQIGDVVGWYNASANIMSYKADPSFDATLHLTFATGPSLNSIVNWGSTALPD